MICLLLWCLVGDTVLAQKAKKNEAPVAVAGGKVKIKNGFFSHHNVTNVTMVNQSVTVATPKAVRVTQVAPTVDQVAARSASVRTRPPVGNCDPERPCCREDYVQWYPAAPVPIQYPCPPPVRHPSPPLNTVSIPRCPDGRPAIGYTTRTYNDGRVIRIYDNGVTERVR